MSSLSTCCTIQPPQQRRHLIYSYFIECTGISEVFKALFKSYLITDEVIKLNRQTDLQLIERIKEVLQLVYPKPLSKITPDLDELRYNAYWRLFGYTIRGRENSFVKVASANREFNRIFESVMYEIFQGILDKGITIERLGNPTALAELLDNLRQLLRNRTFNEIEDISGYWAAAYSSLLSLLDDDTLMRDRLGIRAEGRYRRLIELGEKMRVPVAKSSLYLFILSERLETFLTQVENTPVWDYNTASALFNEEEQFKEISSAWFQITGKDFLADALSRRRPVGQPRQQQLTQPVMTR